MGKLFIYGIKVTKLNALRSLYSKVKSWVILNGVNSEWFNVETVLHQGCSLSPILFNLFNNNLLEKVKLLNLSVVWSFRINDSIHLVFSTFWELSTAQAGDWRRGRWCCTFHYLSWTGSAIFILHFDLVVLEGSSFHQIFLCK